VLSLLDLCLDDSSKELQEKISKEWNNGRAWALSILKSGKALEKMKEIIKEQEGNPDVTSDSLSKEIGEFRESITAHHAGKVKEINSKNITVIAKILGAPHQKGSGIYLDKKLGDSVEKNGILYTLYSQSMYNLKEAKESLKNLQIMRVN